MRQTERSNDHQEALRSMLSGFQSSLWTALPGIVQSYNAEKGTCIIQPAIQARMLSSTGTYAWVSLPPLPDVPVVFMGGGSFVATFPIAAGDEALVIFSSRCIDNWWQAGGVQQQAELRMHDLSDGFAIVGPRSLARSIANVSTSTVQLRSLDGTTYYELAAGGVANIVAPGGVNITGPLTVSGPTTLQDGLSVQGNITGQGNMSLQGSVAATGEGTFNDIEVSQHIHSGVQTGGGETGPPQG